MLTETSAVMPHVVNFLIAPAGAWVFRERIFFSKRRCPYGCDEKHINHPRSTFLRHFFLAWGICAVVFMLLALGHGFTFEKLNPISANHILPTLAPCIGLVLFCVNHTKQCNPVSPIYFTTFWCAGVLCSIMGGYVSEISLARVM